MNIVFLMDPLESIIPEKDTTYVLMLEAEARGHRIFYCDKYGLSKFEDKVRFHVQEVVSNESKQPLFTIKRSVVLTEDTVDVVFIRTDPPFDDLYLYHTWILDLLPDRIKVLNSPRGIRTMNEKIWLSQFHELIPPTVITSKRHDILEFIKKYKTIVLKPTNGYGGQEVYIVEEHSKNFNVIVETMTKYEKVPVIAQQYIAEAEQGDKRILLLNGEPIGAVLRMHSDIDHRNNFFAGGTPLKTTITQQDLDIISIIQPFIKALGLFFVGIDIIGHYLIEINVTSPTCLQEINRLDGVKLEKNIFDALEAL